MRRQRRVLYELIGERPRRLRCVETELIGNPPRKRHVQAVDDRHDVIRHTDGLVRHVRIIHTYNFSRWRCGRPRWRCCRSSWRIRQCPSACRRRPPGQPSGEAVSRRAVRACKQLQQDDASASRFPPLGLHHPGPTPPATDPATAGVQRLGCRLAGFLAVQPPIRQTQECKSPEIAASHERRQSPHRQRGTPTVGRTERRFWDSRTNTSRAARDVDPQDSLFDAFVPHPILDWEPTLDAGTWSRVSQASDRCRTSTMLTVRMTCQPNGWSGALRASLQAPSKKFVRPLVASLEPKPS